MRFAKAKNEYTMLEMIGKRMQVTTEITTTSRTKKYLYIGKMILGTHYLSDALEADLSHLLLYLIGPIVLVLGHLWHPPHVTDRDPYG